jgi:hypothetical protein
VYVDFVVLSGEGVPRQMLHFQGDTLKDLLKAKTKHYRQLKLQTKYLEKLVQKQITANSVEIMRAGIGKPLLIAVLYVLHSCEQN